MFKSIFFLMVTLVLASCITQSTTRVMTYNIRYDTEGDGDDWWELRRDDVVSLIQEYAPDVLGVQEALHRQVTFLDEGLTGYSYVGVGRDDGDMAGEYTALYYNTERLKLINTKTNWLSTTPEQVSVGWDASMERITTYAAFEDMATGEELHVFNAHYDHIGEEARINSSELILQLIRDKGLNDEDVVVMGDFNTPPGSVAYNTLVTQLTDAYQAKSSDDLGPDGTFNGFDLEAEMDRRIDYIFTSGVQVTTYKAIDDRRENGRWPSDHLPVMVDIK